MQLLAAFSSFYACFLQSIQEFIGLVPLFLHPETRPCLAFSGRCEEHERAEDEADSAFCHLAILSFNDFNA